MKEKRNENILNYKMKQEENEVIGERIETEKK